MNAEVFSLSGRKIIITGASSGIGRQCAITCSEFGAQIILLGRDKNRLQETLDLMTGTGHMIFSVDLLDFFEVENVVKLISSSTDKINGLVNCAGISTTLPFSQSTPERIVTFLQTNVTGPMNLTRLILKPVNFCKDGGSIVFISSVMGSAGEMGKHLYSMTKGAIDAGVRSLAIEYALKQIRVNSISPGVVISPMSGRAVYSQDEESLNKVKARHPLGLGNADDIANACVYLLSDASRWVTGINLVVDGGYLAR